MDESELRTRDRGDDTSLHTELPLYNKDIYHDDARFVKRFVGVLCTQAVTPGYSKVRGNS
jgi:hypothetical protein